MAQIYDMFGWDEFANNFSSLVDQWEAKKQILLNRIGLILEAEIKEAITSGDTRAIDTGRLRGSFSLEVGGDYVEYSTNVEYALYVDEGHVQHRRFLPVSTMSLNGGKNYKLYLKSADQRGIMLKERYVPGKHFIDGGMNKAQPRIERATESFMEEIAREIEGGKL